MRQRWERDLVDFQLIFVAVEFGLVGLEMVANERRREERRGEERERGNKPL